MRNNGPEPIIVQIKESLRTSDDLDNRLAEFASLRQQSHLSVINWWAGQKLLVMLSFPTNFTEQQALAVIARLQQSPAVEKVVAQSAFNLEFKSGDFARSYDANQAIPDPARRGFDVDRLSRPHTNYSTTTQLPLHAANRLIVRWKDEYVWKAAQTGFQQHFADFNAQGECTVVEERRYSANDLTQVLEFDPVEYSILDQLRYYQACDWVDYVQPDYIYEPQTVPNDPIYAGSQWSLPKISAPSAWNLTVGSNSVVIAVVDSGANIAHPDFAPNLWSGQNNGEVHNFVYGGTDVSDDSGHGSNVASIIAARGNNNLYMSGVSWMVSLMHLKVVDGFGQFNPPGMSTSLVNGIDYASTHGASAINVSLGLFYCAQSHIDPETGERVCDSPYVVDPMLLDALERARTSNVVGVVVVCAAGNGSPDSPGPGTSTDGTSFSPATAATDNVISVAASDQSDARGSFSNYGVRTVDLAAPGVAIRGLKPIPPNPNNTGDLNNYSIFDGTSQAAPHVTGTIALVKAKYGWENYHGLRDRVLMGTDDIASWSTLVRTGGRLNANKALHPRSLIRNLSTRARVESGDRIMIGGFLIGGSGSGTLKVAIRGLGPSLPNLGVAKLTDPKITLNNSSGQLIYSNNDWGSLPTLQKNDLTANGLTPTDSREAAMVQTLAPGRYTVFLESQNGVYGVGLFEVWELEGGTDEQTRLLNVSTRCIVGVNNEQAIAGVILGDPTQPNNTDLPKRSLLLFGKGPSLLTVPGRLANPFLGLYNSTGTLMSYNDSWSAATASVVKATDSSWTTVSAPVDELIQAQIAPTYAAESALWPILKSGRYTTILSGVSGCTGVGLIEMYEY